MSTLLSAGFGRRSEAMKGEERRRDSKVRSNLAMMAMAEGVTRVEILDND